MLKYVLAAAAAAVAAAVYVSAELALKGTPLAAVAISIAAGGYITTVIGWSASKR